MAKASAAYPNNAPNLKQNPQIFEVWVEMLADFDGQKALDNLNLHIMSSSYFPTIAEIIRKDTNHTTHHELLQHEAEERLRLMDEWEQKATDPPAQLLEKWGEKS